MSAHPDPEAFIAQNLTLCPVPGLPDLMLYQAHPGSGLSRIAGLRGDAPYWAYPWAGGLALALHLRANPQIVHSRHVLDLGAGSGLVAIAAAMAGATQISASDTDPWARSAIRLNAAANGVSIAVRDTDLTKPGQPLPQADLILAGDVFYARGLAPRMLSFLERCAKAGAQVLIGDPGRPALPRDRLELLASYPVRDMGDPPGTVTQGQVFRLLA